MRVAAVVVMMGAGVGLGAIAQSRSGAGDPAGYSLTGYGYAAGSQTNAPSQPAGSSNGFGIGGGVTGLYPGASLPYVVTITNPHPFSIEVTSVTTSVGNAAAGCGSSLLSVTSFSGSLIVPGSGAATLSLTATMSHAAPDSCQGATFALQYAGTAVRP